MALHSNKYKNSLKSSRQMAYWKLFEFTKFRDYYYYCFIAWNAMSYLKNFTRMTRCWIALIFAVWTISGDEGNLIGKLGGQGWVQNISKKVIVLAMTISWKERSSPSEVFLENVVLKICNNFIVASQLYRIRTSA